MKRENKYQAELIRKIKRIFKGCIVLKMDALRIQGLPDLLILFRNRWAALEVKRCAKAPHRPNQDYYVKKLDEMSFARFIYPENEKEILNELRVYFTRQSNKQTRISVSEPVFVVA